jgi:hypothetical protein
MDVIAHGLWSNIALYKKYPNEPKKRWIGVAFGVLPDIIPFAPSFIYLFITGVRFNMQDALYSQHWVHMWAREAYNYTHSLVIFAAVVIVVTLLRKGRVYWPMLTWGLHILMDIPTHPNFYNTPFLFPVSGFKFQNLGLPWSHAYIMIPQYAIFAVWYGWWFVRGRKK